jgi:hypothetical protein
MIRSLELPNFPKIFNIPPSIQKYLKPMLMASVGLHVFALLAPLPADQLDQKSHRPKTVRLTSQKPFRKKAKTIPKSPPPAKALPKVSVVALSSKGLVIPGPPKKQTAAPTPTPKGKPPTEKKNEGAKSQEKKKQEGSKAQTGKEDQKKNNNQKSKDTGGGSSGGSGDFFQNLVANLSDNTDVGPELFSSPADFFPDYKKPEPNAPLGFDIPPKRADIIADSRIVKSKTPQQIYDNLLPSLTQNSYVSTSVPAGYGGGQLYKIDGGKNPPMYLNLVPTSDGKNTVVVTWSADPSN